MIKYIWPRYKIPLQIAGLLVAYKSAYYFIAYFCYYYTYRVELFDAGKFWQGLTCQWDCQHYLEIAHNGYQAAQTAFYPLYPLLLNLLSKLVGYNWAVALISNISLFLALWGLYLVARLDVGRRSAWRALLYLIIFPTALFLSAAYTESLFLALALWTFYWARQGRWLMAGFVALLAGLTRIEGQALTIFLVAEYLIQKKFKFKELASDFWYCLAPILGLGLYSVYLWRVFGDAWLFLHAQAGWGKQFTWPWQTWWSYLVDLSLFNDPLSLKWFIPKLLDWLAFSSSLLLGIVLWRKVRLSYGLYVLVAALMVSFTGDLASTNRRQLLYFPIFILLGVWGKKRWLDLMIIFISMGLLTVNLYRWVYGTWVG
jgi:hypothetical protein